MHFTSGQPSLKIHLKPCSPCIRVKWVKMVPFATKCGVKNELRGAEELARVRASIFFVWGWERKERGTLSPPHLTVNKVINSNSWERRERQERPFSGEETADDGSLTFDPFELIIYFTCNNIIFKLSNLSRKLTSQRPVTWNLSLWAENGKREWRKTKPRSSVIWTQIINF